MGVLVQRPIGEDVITVVSPVLNEIDFLPAWCENVEKYAGEVIVCDTGSTDGSAEFLEDRAYTVLHEKIDGPYLWDEGKVRNRMLDLARGEWIFRHDCDELWGGDFFRDLPSILDTSKLFIYARQLPFAYRPWLVRTRYWSKEYPLMKWRNDYPVGWMPVAWRNSPHIRHRETGHNYGPIELCGLGKMSPRLSRVKIPHWLYHYNLLNPNKAGIRKHEMRNTGIRLATYFEKHPDEVKHYPFMEG